MDFDGFIVQLLEESKAFLEKAKKEASEEAKSAYLHSSLLLVMSSLEACVNSISEELLVEPYIEKYSIVEQSLLLEKEFVFDKGKFVLGNKLKMYRITDRIEFLVHKFTGEKIQSDTLWFAQLKQSIEIRNRLVHPKEYIKISEKQVENAINSVLETINELYKVVYKKSFPQYAFGLISRCDI